MNYQAALRFATVATLGTGSTLVMHMMLSQPAHAMRASRPMIPAHSTVNDPMADRRAINLAREYGIKLNGGLGKYRPGKCMFQAPSQNPCLARKDAQGYIFHFPGGSPGWQEYGQPPALMTILRVTSDGRNIPEVIYNGAAAR